MENKSLKAEVLDELSKVILLVRENELLVNQIKNGSDMLNERKDELLNDLNTKATHLISLFGPSEEEKIYNELEEIKLSLSLYEDVSKVLAKRIEEENQVYVEKVKKEGLPSNSDDICPLYSELVQDTLYQHDLVVYDSGVYNIFLVVTTVSSQSNNKTEIFAYVLSMNNIDAFIETVADAFEDELTNEDGIFIRALPETIVEFFETKNMLL